AKAAPLRACRLALADLPPDWIAFARPRGLVQGLRDGDRLTADQEPTAQRPMAASDSSMLGAALGAARGRREWPALAAPAPGFSGTSGTSVSVRSSHEAR